MNRLGFVVKMSKVKVTAKFYRRKHPDRRFAVKYRLVISRLVNAVRVRFDSHL